MTAITEPTLRPAAGIGVSAGNIRVCQKPDDIPPNEGIISGVRKSDVIRLTQEDADRVVVIRRGKTVQIVMSTALHGSSDAMRIFTYVREQIQQQRYEDGPSVWAIPRLVKELANVRADAGASSKDSDVVEAYNTDHGRRLNHWLEYGLDMMASDIHVEVRPSGATIRYRIHGKMEPMQNGQDGQVVADHAKDSVAIAFNKLSDENSVTGTHFNPNEFLSSTVTINTGKHHAKMRCESIPMTNGYDFIARFSREGDTQVNYSYESIGYAPSQVKLIRQSVESLRGLIIVAGIPGSGKTVTVQTALESLPLKETLKIATIDDPVEKELSGVSHTSLKIDVSDQAEATKRYNEAVSHWLRGNPDVMSMGEIRGVASGVAALTFAEVGCLTFGTLHAHSALGCFQRLLSPAVGIDLHALTAPRIMNLFMYQALVPVLCPACSIALEDMPVETKNRMGRVSEKFDVDTAKMRFHNRQSDCPHCNKRGTTGRTAVAEMIPHNRTILKHILDRDLFSAETHWLSQGDGSFSSDDMTGKTIFHHAFYKALQGQIDPSTVERFDNFDTFDLELGRKVAS